MKTSRFLMISYDVNFLQDIEIPGWCPARSVLTHGKMMLLYSPAELVKTEPELLGQLRLT